jgi:hypothetical protein
MNRFEFRDTKAGEKDMKEKKKQEFDSEKERLLYNKKKFDDIFSGKLEMISTDQQDKDEKKAAKEEYKKTRAAGKEKVANALNRGRRASVGGAVYQAGTKDHPLHAGPMLSPKASEQKKGFADGEGAEGTNPPTPVARSRRGSVSGSSTPLMPGTPAARSRRGSVSGTSTPLMPGTPATPISRRASTGAQGGGRRASISGAATPTSAAQPGGV